MTDETLKLTRKQRRWTIAAVLLFIVAVTGWWYWPRGDTRFVGVWRSRHIVIDGLEECPDAKWHLYRNGSLYIDWVWTNSAERRSWRVEEDLFVMGWPKPSKWDIIQIEKDTIVIHPHDNRRIMVELVRLPE
jgi:hypothetical protein